MQTCPRCGSILPENSPRCPSCRPVSLSGVGGAPAAERPAEPPSAPVLGAPPRSAEMQEMMAAYADHHQRDRRSATLATTLMVGAALVALIIVGTSWYGRAQATRQHAALRQQ
jgi:hypothetical protein